MRSVIRRKIWEGRYEFGTEEQRTSGKGGYVVGKYRNYFFHTCELFIFQVLIQTWTKKIPATKKLDSCLAGYKKDFARRADIPQLTR